MIIDLNQSEGVPLRHSSVCIAGAGAAGICLAVELARLGLSVTLLESGGLKEERATQDLYASEVSGIRHNGIHNGRFRVFGGSTTRWAGRILELDSHNFETRPWVPNSGWPFSKRALTHHYQRALELEGLASVISDDESVWQAIHSRPEFGEELVPFFSRWCPEPNFAVLHGQTLRQSPRINVYLHANVREILLEEGCQAIGGLDCQTLGGRRAVFTADRYVFCLGGIETARILLQPLAQASTSPWNAFGLVGRYFQDHIDSILLEVKPWNRRKLHQWFDNVYRKGIKYAPQLKLSFREQRRLECLAIGSSFQSGNDRTGALDKFREVAGQMRRGQIWAGLAQAASYLPQTGLLLRKAIRFGLRGRGYNPNDAGIFLRFHCEQVPNPDSRIELTSERDATGLFRCRLHWTVTDQEIRTMKEFARIVGDAFRRNGFADAVPNPVLEASGSDLIDLCDDSFHHMGATRMADAPQRGVVDENLQLFEIRNGYVCSSSVFPTSGFSNPTHTIIALALRLAEHLATMQTDVRVATPEANVKHHTDVMWARQSSLRWSSGKSVSSERRGLGCGTIRASQRHVLERT